ncbi:MAG: asparagine synthase (glutamine-hydrolyzing) [Rickettsiaceae bacterium]|nr:asparagine synthase (glutamine-hydrolyzing) [Rickettsiaceae bacterium]
MCGIFGILSDKKTAIDKKLFAQSAKLMQHRGPDAYGQWGINNKIELGHLRLAIVDLKSESNQPFFSTCRRYVIVFNGEIYNYIELREELIKSGYVFRTESDTEVLLNAYIEWGETCVSRFNGDWAFAIYDINNDILFCSRDRFGVKPFNYALTDNGFIFSSEIKSIIHFDNRFKNPNLNIILNYCKNSLGAQSYDTWFDGIKRLQPAHNLLIKDGEILIYRYWDYPREVSFSNFNVAVEEYKKLFMSSVKLRMRSDVPVGITLSSGIDSTSIAALVKKLGGSYKTYTADFTQNSFVDNENIGYKNAIELNEYDIVKKFTQDIGFESNRIVIDNSRFVSDLRKVLYYLESGHSSHATIPLMQVMEEAKKKVTVLLEGQGADELLAGYVIRFYPWSILHHLKRLNFVLAYNEYKEFSKTYSLSYTFLLFLRMLNIEILETFYQRFIGINKLFKNISSDYRRIKDYPVKPTGFNDKLNSELFKSHTGGLVNLLHYGDAISMSQSLESRNPFTDHRLVELCFKYPSIFKLKKGLGKYIHRVSMENTLPHYIVSNKLKLGFNSPLAKHFLSYDSEAIKILLSDRCINRGFFDSSSLKKIIEKNIRKNGKYSSFLFRVLSVELWHQEFIDK